jgi:hypothetical protein
MNKIYIIGNGFDLAHGLKTRYSDFLLGYINKVIKEFKKANYSMVKDGLTSLDCRYRLNEFDSLQSFKEATKRKDVTFTWSNDFFGTIFNNACDCKWVDIEYEYFWKLLGIYKNIEKHRMERDYHFENLALDLNNCLDCIKCELVEYLCSINPVVTNPSIQIRLKTDLGKISYNEVLFLVFNYTSTIEPYLELLNINKASIIYIHGKLGDQENPIIFGYGDEMNEYYSKIEALNINEFTRHLKSFSYLKSINYQNLTKFIDKSPYTISIMGHSCGLSDRVLLNSLLCNKNCEGIQIYYHQKSPTENDYFEKTQEISRHFPLQEKNRMRNIIVPFSHSCSLT